MVISLPNTLTPSFNPLDTYQKNKVGAVNINLILTNLLIPGDIITLNIPTTAYTADSQTLNCIFDICTINTVSSNANNLIIDI